ncbi:MAG: T9SS type A sorting domain-containing protein [Armatimonadetes bacterium]|nr:T9SS type A sorting domain-containing protein [Armatimonadota bacterium]
MYLAEIEDQMKKSILLFLFLFYVFFSYLFSDYEVIERIPLDVINATYTIHLEGNNFLTFAGKTIREIEYNETEYEILNTFYINHVIAQRPLIRQNSLFIPTMYNGLEVYHYQNQQLEYLQTIGLVSNENNIYAHSGSYLFEDFLFWTASYYIGENFQHQEIEIYNIEDEPQLVGYHNLYIQDFILKITKHENLLYFYHYDGSISYCYESELEVFNLNPVIYNQMPSYHIFGAYIFQNYALIYFHNEIDGVLKVYEIVDDSHFEEVDSISMPVTPYSPICYQINDQLYLGACWFENNNSNFGIMRYNFQNGQLAFLAERNYNQWAFDYIPFDANFIVFGREENFLINDNLDPIYTFFELDSFNARDVLKNRFILLQNLNDSNYLIFDIETGEFLDFSSNSWYQKIQRRDDTDNIIFYGYDTSIEVVIFDEEGITNVSSYDLGYPVYVADWYYDRLVTITFSDDLMYVYYYEVDDNFELSLIHIFELEPYTYFNIGILLIDETYIAIFDKTENITYYHKIENNDLSLLTTFQTLTVSNVFFCQNQLIYPYENGPIIDCTNADDPQIIGNIPYYYNSDAPGLPSYNGNSQYVFDSAIRVSILDQNFNIIDTWFGFEQTFFLNDDLIIISEYDHLTLASVENIQSVEEEIVSQSNYIFNYPNPFNPSTTIYFETTNLHENSRIEIFNIKGQKIKQYSIFPEQSQAPYGAGNNQSSIVWNGTDENYQSVASGLYFYKMSSGKETQVKKMLLLK